MATPKVDKADKNRLHQLLSDGGWHKNRTIPMKSRLIRACCEAEPGHFLSGQQGYKLFQAATAEEITASIADLRSRARHITLRADGLDQALYNRSFPDQKRLAL